MKKKFSYRISRMMSPFRSCCQILSTSANSPVFRSGFDLNFPSSTMTPPPQPLTSPARRRKVAVVVESKGGFCRPCASLKRRRRRRGSTPVRLRGMSPAVDYGEDDMSTARETPVYLWRKEEKCHVVSREEEVRRRRRRRRRRRTRTREKVDSSCEEEEEDDDGDDLFPSDFSRMAARRKREIEIRRRRRQGKPPPPRSKSRNSISSIASANWFSSEDNNDNDERSEDDNDNIRNDGVIDTDTLLTSRSFSTDSSPVRYPASPEPKPRSRMLSRLVSCGGSSGGETHEGKVVRESFAVVKQSEDPQGDFRQSMAEMVVERGMFDAAALDQLLHCFLSLNSQHHHGAIVSAFNDIWEALFPESSPHVNCY